MNAKQEIPYMQKVLQRLGIPLQVVWIPDAGSIRHREIQKDCILIYDNRQEDAWATFIHETLEYKLKKISVFYRMIINSLITVLEKTVYEEKERFIDCIPELFRIVQEEKKESK